jgi:hypothetical protein
MSFGARFLRHPEGFPERQAGDAWGDRELTIDLPGGPYRVLGLSAAQDASVRATFPGSLGAHATDAADGAAAAADDDDAADGMASRPAAVPSAVAAGPSIPILLLRHAAGEFLPVDVRGWEYGLDFDWSPAAVRLAGLGLVGRLDWPPDRAGMRGALWTPEDGGERFPGVFENFLRVLVSYRLLELGGAVLHSAGVVRDGAAFLFLGRSGAGKTTVARLSLAQGAEVLSDDLNAVVAGAPGTGEDADAPRAAGAAGVSGCAVLKLPFTGDLGDRRAVLPPVPLGALLRLEQATADALLPLSRAETLACLLACTPFVNLDPHRRERLEEVLLALAAAAAPRAYTLRFTLGGGFWSIIDTK